MGMVVLNKITIALDKIKGLWEIYNDHDKSTTLTKEVHICMSSKLVLVDDGGVLICKGAKILPVDNYIIVYKDCPCMNQKGCNPNCPCANPFMSGACNICN